MEDLFPVDRKHAFNVVAEVIDELLGGLRVLDDVHDALNVVKTCVFLLTVLFYSVAFVVLVVLIIYLSRRATGRNPPNNPEPVLLYPPAAQYTPAPSQYTQFSKATSEPPSRTRRLSVGEQSLAGLGHVTTATVRPNGHAVKQPYKPVLILDEFREVDGVATGRYIQRTTSIGSEGHKEIRSLNLSEILLPPRSGDVIVNASAITGEEDMV